MIYACNYFTIILKVALATEVFEVRKLW